MEIPYIVTPRKDTGLFNSKIAIWLFLASEVMLFGGFFSAYIFLRLGADYPWPERTLPVLPGLINTFVLIFSSVTVVFAWAALKMRQWGKFQIYMGITVICSFIFMGLKGIEYNVKFHHQALRTKDYSVVEGHTSYQLKDGVELEHGENPTDEQIARDLDGDKLEMNLINFEASRITFNTVRYHKPWVEEMMARADEKGATLALPDDIKLQTAPGKEVVFEKGTKLDLKLLASIREAHLAARAHNTALRTENYREQWRKAKEANPGKRGWQLNEGVVIDLPAIKDQLMPEQAAIAFDVTPPVAFRFQPRDIKEFPEAGNLRDGTALVGKLLDSPLDFHYVDALDFRHLAMKVREKLGVKHDAPATPEVEAAIEKAIEDSWLLKENKDLAKVWQRQQQALVKLREFLASKGKVPTEKDKYRINWQEMAFYYDDEAFNLDSYDPSKSWAPPKVEENMKEKFFGPDYEIRKFPHLNVPRDQVQFATKFEPAWNTYYAIYFTMTGLHGLHVIGGALVLAYYLFFGKGMYLTNPEWLANRVEVGGLFWHFVDLVWIFLFPILYLM